MQDYYNNIDSLLDYIKELSDMYPKKSLTELISMSGDVVVPYIDNKSLTDSIKKVILQNM